MSVSNDAARGLAVPPNRAQPGSPLDAEGLSARSYGVFCHMLNARTDWFTVSSLMEVFTDRRDGLNTTMAELIDAGLIVTVERREKNLIRRGYQVAP